MKRRQLYHLLSAILLFCFSGTFLLMPVAGRVDQRNVRAALGVVGALFWVTGIGGYALFFLVRRMDGKRVRAERKAESRETKRQGFSAGWVTVTLDIAALAGVVILLVWSGKPFMQRVGAYVVLFITTMAFHTRLLISNRPDRGQKAGRSGRKTDQGGQKADQRGKKAGQSGQRAGQSGQRAGQSGKKADQGGQKTDRSVEKVSQSVPKADQGVEKAGQGGKKTDRSVEKVSQSVPKADQGVEKAVQGVEKKDQSKGKAGRSGRKAHRGGRKVDQGGKKGTERKDVGRK